MKSRLLLIPAILVTTAALADTSSAFSDAQGQAAALLSRPLNVRNRQCAQ